MYTAAAWVCANCRFAILRKEFIDEIADSAIRMKRNDPSWLNFEAAQKAMNQWMAQKLKEHSKDIAYYQEVLTERLPNQAGGKMHYNAYSFLKRTLEREGKPAPYIPSIILGHHGLKKTTMLEVVKRLEEEFGRDYGATSPAYLPKRERPQVSPQLHVQPPSRPLTRLSPTMPTMVTI